MLATYEAAPDIRVITEDFPIPGFGQIPINAFVVDGAEPMLVDTGTVVHRQEFMAALRAVIDPQELRWLWLTHTDFDHIGSLAPLLEENPKLRLITTYLGVGIMSLSTPLSLDRVHLLNPGQRIVVGKRTLTALRPPTFDNPSTTGFFDETSRVLFSSDCFGALLQAVPQRAAELDERDLRDGMVFWATVDSPWLHQVDRKAFAGELERVRAMEPRLVLSSHLPVATGDLTDRLLGALAAAPEARPFVGPDQAAIEQMLKPMTEGPR